MKSGDVNRLRMYTPLSKYSTYVCTQCIIVYVSTYILFYVTDVESTNYRGNINLTHNII